MDDFPVAFNFGSDEELVRFFNEKVDDIDGVTVMVVNDMPMSAPNNPPKLVRDCCSQILMCDGRSILLNTADLQLVLDSGCLHRNGIKIKLVKQFADS